MNIKQLCIDAHENSKNHGFWEGKQNIGEKLMLIVSELAEALEADRENRKADVDLFETIGHNNQVSDEEWEIINFENCIKDSFEDEIADVFIRLGDLCGGYNIYIEKFIKLKLNYNKTRPIKHNKKY